MRITLLGFLLLTGVFAKAGDLGLPATINGLPKAGELRYRYFFFKIFDAALYAPRDATGETLLKPGTPRALLVRYHRDVSAEQFIEVARGSLEEQLDAGELQAISAPLEQLNRSYRDVGKGDTYLLGWYPDSGMQISLNGELLTVIDSADFARDYFKIWFGDDPLSAKLRDELLAGLDNDS